MKRPPKTHEPIWKDPNQLNMAELREVFLAFKIVFDQTERRTLLFQRYVRVAACESPESLECWLEQDTFQPPLPAPEQLVVPKLKIFLALYEVDYPAQASRGHLLKLYNSLAERLDPSQRASTAVVIPCKRPRPTRPPPKKHKSNTNQDLPPTSSSARNVNHDLLPSSSSAPPVTTSSPPLPFENTNQQSSQDLSTLPPPSHVARSKRAKIQARDSARYSPYTRQASHEVQQTPQTPVASRITRARRSSQTSGTSEGAAHYLERQDPQEDPPPRQSPRLRAARESRSLATSTTSAGSEVGEQQTTSTSPTSVASSSAQTTRSYARSSTSRTSATSRSSGAYSLRRSPMAASPHDLNNLYDSDSDDSDFAHDGIDGSDGSDSDDSDYDYCIHVGEVEWLAADCHRNGAGVCPRENSVAASDDSQIIRGESFEPTPANLLGRPQRSTVPVSEPPLPEDSYHTELFPTRRIPRASPRASSEPPTPEVDNTSNKGTHSSRTSQSPSSANSQQSLQEYAPQSQHVALDSPSLHSSIGHLDGTTSGEPERRDSEPVSSVPANSESDAYVGSSIADNTDMPTHREVSQQSSSPAHRNSELARSSVSSGSGFEASIEAHTAVEPDSTQELVVPDESTQEVVSDGSPQAGLPSPRTPHGDPAASRPPASSRKRKSEPPLHWPEPSELSRTEIQAYLDRHNVRYTEASRMSRLVGSYNLLRCSHSGRSPKRPKSPASAVSDPSSSKPRSRRVRFRVEVQDSIDDEEVGFVYTPELAPASISPSLAASSSNFSPSLAASSSNY
ncbi:hypothetical protein PTTG_05668 [Puccinia triticina 1-1 BBBD Race 1]|uniref:Uncharacterized protein n=1 Tax=Puccinia triticina (isolate 1-1 / race 1 (BBBD)) TaxID=630390 RepID=A0A180G4J3_PUCT1|nr:hypothetical protein PTTG_05668 [Puccinia triticina 1-1 BBBD Race 1]